MSLSRLYGPCLHDHQITKTNPCYRCIWLFLHKPVWKTQRAGWTCCDLPCVFVVWRSYIAAYERALAFAACTLMLAQAIEITFFVFAFFGFDFHFKQQFGTVTIRIIDKIFFIQYNIEINKEI